MKQETMSREREIGVELARKGKFKEAIMFLEKALLNDDETSINDIGVVAERSQKFDLAAKCYAMAAMLGQTEAMCNLGNMLENGIGIESNYTAAFLLFRRAASLNHPRGYYRMSRMFEMGMGVRKNKKKALEALINGSKYETDSFQGCTDTLAYYYLNGLMVKEDEQKALELYLKASRNGCKTAAYNVGYIYLYSKDKKIRNGKKGVEYMLKAAEGGYPDAYAMLASLYKDGYIVKKDIEIYNYWLKKGVMSDSPKAILMLAEDQLNNKKNGIDGAEYWIGYYLVNLKEYHQENTGTYLSLRDKYKNKVDWDDIEANPETYINKTNKIAEC